MYNSEQISAAIRIYYYLLQYGELSIEDDKELYRAYADSEEVMNLVRTYGSESDCSIERYNGVLYLIPGENNEFLGFSKADLKRRLCRSDANDKDYYLSQFMILTLLSTFYNSNGRSSKSRSFIKLGEFMNLVSEKLALAETYQGIEEIEKKSGLAVCNLLEKWNALKGSDVRTTSRTTKEGFITGIIRFMEEQGLFDYIEEDDMLKPTKKLDNFIDWNILNRSNYETILEAFQEIEERTIGGQYEQA
jgi:hypothetical protein